MQLQTAFYSTMLTDPLDASISTWAGIDRHRLSLSNPSPVEVNDIGGLEFGITKERKI